MAKSFTEWTVLPHGKLTRIEDNILSVTGSMHMPMGYVERRMTVARLLDGRLVVFSAIALDDDEMSALERFGTFAYLVVPSGIHRMDAKIWKERYPRMRVIAPAGAREKVEEIVHVDSSALDTADRSVHFVAVPGTGEREGALIVDTGEGTTLVLNDLVFNLPHRRGLSGWFFKRLGVTGDEPHLPGFVEMRLVRDKAALSAQLERWAHLPRLKRVIVAHGSIIVDNPARALERIAHDIAA